MRRKTSLLAARKRWLRAAVIGVPLLAGCAGSGEGLDQNGRPLTPGGGTTGALTADFNSIQQHVFTPICSVCHAGGSAPEGLRLDASNSYSLLVGVPSTEVPSVLRVKPGDPDNSYIIQKLEGTAAVGARMPFGGPYLDAATIAVIRQWISDGAMQSAATASGQSFAAVAVTPSMRDVVIEPPARIVIAFNKELDQTRIDATSVRLEMLDRAGGEARSVPVSLAVPLGNPRALMIEPQHPLANGVYRLSVSAPPETGVASIEGEPLGAVATLGDGLLITEFEVAGEP